jgi:hypothetical protein
LFRQAAATRRRQLEIKRASPLTRPAGTGTDKPILDAGLGYQVQVIFQQHPQAVALKLVRPPVDDAPNMSAEPFSQVAGLKSDQRRYWRKSAC